MNFQKKLLQLLSGSIVLQAISMLAQPLLTRMYTPGDYGLFASMQAIVGIYSVVGCLCFDRAIVIAEKRSEAIKLVKLSMFLLLVNSILFLLICLPFFWRMLFNTDFSYLKWLLLFFWTLTSGINVIFINYHNRLAQYKKLSLRQIKSGILGLLSQVIFGFCHFGIFGLAFGGLLNVLYSLKLLYVKVVLFKINILKQLKFVFSKYIHFPKFQLPSVFLETVSMQIVVLLINKELGSYIAGQYALAYKLLAVPLTVVGSAFSVAFYREFNIKFKSGDKPLLFVYKNWILLTVIGLIPCAIVLIYAEKFFPLIFGEHWKMAGWFAKYLCLMTFIMLITSPTSTAFIVMGSQHFQFAFSIYVFFARIFSVYIMKSSMLSGLLFLIISEVIGMLVYNLMIIIVLRGVVRE